MSEAGDVAAMQLHGALVELALHLIRRDGGTQCRVAISPAIVRDYAHQMAAGEEFPPIHVWYDGTDYWLSDGFQRVAAAEQIGRTCIAALVSYGTLSDAQWASCRSNSAHGSRRSGRDVLVAISRAIEHPNAQSLSNRELARHIGAPEATVRRWRARLSSSSDKTFTKRFVTRNGIRYTMDVSSISISAKAANHQVGDRKNLKQIETELREMKDRSAPKVRALVNIFANWALGPVNAADCLKALHRFVDRLERKGLLERVCD
jgi:hypothetical protein